VFLQGKLMGFDVRANIILADSVEREFSEDEGVEMVPLGLYMIKGDNVYVRWIDCFE
jgi:U6 snRNA-associated Sm-like protein LSm8